MSRLIQGPDPRVWGSRDGNFSIDPGFREMHLEISAWLKSESLPLSYRHSFKSLLQTKCTEIFFSDLANLGQQATQDGHLELAMGLNQLIEKHAPEAKQKQRAILNQAALRGGYSSFAENLEFQTGRFLAETTRPATLFAMVGAGLAYRAGMSLGLRWGAGLGEANLGGRLARVSLAPALGFSMEVPTFVCGEKLMAQALGQRVSWEHWSEAMGQAALLFGAMKWGGRAGMRMKGFMGQRGWDGPLLGSLWTQGGLLAGLELGTRLGNEGNRSFFDNIVLLLQFSAAQGLIGPMVRGQYRDTKLGRLNVNEPGRSKHAWATSGIPGGRYRMNTPWEARAYMVSHDGKGPVPTLRRPAPTLNGLIVEITPGRKHLLQEAQDSTGGGELWTLTEIRYKKIVLMPSEEIGQEGARRIEISHRLWRDFEAQQGREFFAIPYLEPKLTDLLGRSAQELLSRLEQNRMTHQELQALLEEPALVQTRDFRISFYQWNPRSWFHHRRADPQAVGLIHHMHRLKHPLGPDLLARTDFSYFTLKQMQQNPDLMKTVGLTQKITPENSSALELWRELPESQPSPYEKSDLDPK